MPPVQKKDNKRLLSARPRTKRLMWPPAHEPDATSFSAAEKGPIKTNTTSFAEDFTSEHSSSGAVVAPADQVAGPHPSRPPAVSKSAPA